jgi:predicted nucleic acid-binding protein
MFLVDTSVLVDLANLNSTWFDWSAVAMARALRAGPVGVNPIIYAELAIAYDDIESLDEAIGGLGLKKFDLPYEAGFLAGRAFLAYRRRGGQRSSPLPDFFIGAHAAVTGLRLITRDAGRVRTYFPGVETIAPD